MLRKIANRFVALVLIAGCLLASPAFAVADYVTGSVQVTGMRTTSPYTYTDPTTGKQVTTPLFGWDFSYIRSFDGTVLNKHLEINFTFDAALNFTEAQKAAYRAAAEANIEGIWNNKFYVWDTSNGNVFPITVDVTTTGPFNQTVRVKQSQGKDDPPYNMTNWYINEDTAATQAHEFGHMLGLFDEYLGGAVDQFPNPTLTDTGLMGLGALLANPEMFPRYYQQYIDYISALNPGRTFQFGVVPEPSTAVLAIIAISILCWTRRHWLRQAAWGRL